MADNQQPDREEDLQRKLKRTGPGGLPDDADSQVDENRNLSGSSTWETLPSQAGEHLQHSRKGQAESPNDLNHEEQPKQRKGGY